MKFEPFKRPTHFYTTPLQPCPYLDDQVERKIFTELSGNQSREHYNHLSRGGFRRSHHIAYAPACPKCQACLAARIDLVNFKPSKSQKRTLKLNQSLQMAEAPSVATDEQFKLFSRYVVSRHGDGEMATMGRIDYRFLVEETSLDSHILEFRDSTGQLIAACLIDVLDDGISAVYSFFNPDNPKLSLGNFMVLSLVSYAKSLDLPYVYLGFWIKGSPKMSYKERFRPLEVFINGNWEKLPSEDL
ncbi:MAG: arginyltransferase [Alphaproteobacteria bacterium]|nr:arginyltransferase [Rhodospirillales bacterium]MCW9044906.1 arginyltransferase [Alphaproteobacteria bacterium]